MLITNLFEADPIDFAAAKRKRDQARQNSELQSKVPDSLRYAAAVSKQSTTEPTSLSDVARNIILRNIDKVFSGEPLPDEDRDQLQAIVKVNDYLHTMQRGDLVKTVIKLYQKETSTKTYMGYPNPRDAYINDDPRLGKYRLYVGDQVHTFDHELQLQSYVLTNLLRDGAEWSDDDKKTLRQQIENLTDAVDEPYDPTARDMGFDDQPREHEVLAQVEKILKPYEWSDQRSRVWLQFNYLDHLTGEYGTPTLTFHNRTSPERKMTFATLPELEQWVIAHQDGIAHWYQRQQTVEHSDLARIRFTERKMLTMLRQIIAGTADPERTRDEAYTLIDHVIAEIRGYPEVKQSLDQIAHDLGSQRAWRFWEPSHLEWLPEHIKELMAKSVG